MSGSFVSQYWISAGGICLESDIVSSSTLTPTVQQHSRELLIGPTPQTSVFPRGEERQIPAPPFDQPSTVPLDMHTTRPVQPRKTVFIQDLGDPRLSLTASIPVALDFWGDSVTACCYDLEDFGVGQDEFSALADLKGSLVDLYFLLKAEADRLGPLPERHWRYLRSITREH